MDEIAFAITKEQGKTLSEAQAEVLRAADFLEFGGALARMAEGSLIPSRDPNLEQKVFREPIGTAALFTPWNFPIVLIAKKLSSALAAGCSVVAKPSEETPTAATELAKACFAAGLPTEVLTVVFGHPQAIVEQLIASPEIRKISFTGSTAIGKLIAAQAGKYMKPVTMELGGHAPVIITQSADLGEVVPQLVDRKFGNAGQACISPTRFIVHDSIYDEFIAAFADAADRIIVGNGADDAVQMGPVANSRRVSALNKLIAEAVNRGARPATVRRTLPSDGYFVAPLVLADTPSDAEIMKVEPFGPVAPVIKFSALDDAITLANSSDYGLAAYAFSNEPREQFRFQRDLNAGLVGINNCPSHLPELPMGGLLDSGFGVEGGAASMAPYQRQRSVAVVPLTGEAL